MCVLICRAGVRCWPVDLDVSVLDQQLKLFVSRHSAFLSEHVPGEKTPFTHTSCLFVVVVVMSRCEVRAVEDYIIPLSLSCLKLQLINFCSNTNVELSVI